MNLRLDDLGASSKQYERWSRHRWANVWPLHDRRLFGAWGPYRELAPWQMEIIFSACARARRAAEVEDALARVRLDERTHDLEPQKRPRRLAQVRLCHRVHE